MGMARPLALAGLIISALSLAGCTPSSDPVVDQVLAADLGALKLVNPEVKGYCYPTELFCSNPLFEPAFSAPATADPLEICDAVISLQSEIGLVAYAAEGAAAGKVENLQKLKDFCVEGFLQPLTNFDDSISYEGTVLFDDGATDGVGKVTVISRYADGTYFVVFSLSRNLSRVGWIPFGDEPKHQKP